MEGTDRLIVAAWMTFFVLLTPIIFAALDFRSGVRKAKMRGEPITSDGWRRSIIKVSQYYNILFGVLVIDAIQMATIWYLDMYHGHDLPVLPFLTFIVAVIIGVIEVKSIYEKAEDKVKKETKDAAALIASIIANKSNPEELAKELEGFLKK